MKKRILIVVENFDTNGATISLMNLLDSIDYDRYCIDVFALIHRGELLKRLPKCVNLLQEDTYGHLYECALSEAIRCKRLSIIIIRILSAAVKICDELKGIEIREKILKRSAHIKREYYMAIAYSEGAPHNFVLNKVCSCIKIGWIHTNAFHIKGNTLKIRNELCKFDCCVAVSEQGRKELATRFGINNTVTKYNIIPYKQIDHKKSLNTVTWNTDKIKIFTMARLSREKRIDIAIKAAAYMKQDGYDFEWRIAGEGSQYRKLKSLIEDVKVGDCVFLVKNRTNPYIELGKADIYVQTSEFEGRSIAVDEAMYLCKPLVVTNNGSFKEQVVNGINGLMAQLNEKDFAEKIEWMIDNCSARRRYSEQLQIRRGQLESRDYIGEIIDFVEEKQQSLEKKTTNY